MTKQEINPLAMLGIGIGVGILGMWTLVELFPLLVLSGAGYLVFQGMKSKNTKAQEDTCNTGQVKR